MLYFLRKFIPACFGFIITAAILILPTSTVFAGERVYASETLGLWSTPGDNGKIAGKIMASSPLEIIAEQGEWRQVAFSGWSQEGNERAVYYYPGIRILTAALKAEKAKSGRAETQLVDEDTGITWAKINYTGWVKKPQTTPDLSSLWADAENLFSEKCTMCHVRRITDHYTANQWVSYLKIMGPRTGLPKDKQHLILKYLQHHASDTIHRPQTVSGAPK